jgi:hypothetical protein
VQNAYMLCGFRGGGAAWMQVCAVKCAGLFAMFAVLQCVVSCLILCWGSTESDSPAYSLIRLSNQVLWRSLVL